MGAVAAAPRVFVVVPVVAVARVVVVTGFGATVVVGMGCASVGALMVGVLDPVGALDPVGIVEALAPGTAVGAGSGGSVVVGTSPTFGSTAT